MKTTKISVFKVVLVCVLIGFVRTKASVDKQSILNHFKATGEIPEGCEIERPDKKLIVNTIQTNKGG